MEQQTKQEEMAAGTEENFLSERYGRSAGNSFCFNICRDPAVRICDSSGNR